MKEPIISLTEVRKRVGTEFILKGVELYVLRGEFLSVVGPSGSGKSSLLYIMGLLDKPTEGKVLFEGREVDFGKENLLSKLRNEKIGFIFQFHYLLPEFSALENVALPMIKAGLSKRDAFDRAQELLVKVGLKGKEGKRPFQLSGGEQQRVAIARALSNNPLLILADEPTGNLDSRNTELIMDILLSLNEEGRTIVMVTHDENLSLRTHRILELKDGRIVNEKLQRLYGG